MNAVRPLFPVDQPSTRSADENVKALADFCHVVEVQGPWALVHASPVGVGNIVQKLALEVFPAKRGAEYYAVRVGAKRLEAVKPSTELSRRPVARPMGQPERLVIRGMRYLVKETNTKRRIDVRRFEVRKLDGDQIDAPYVVAFQDHDGTKSACSCKDWIFRRRHCKHIQAIQAKFGG